MFHLKMAMAPSPSAMADWVLPYLRSEVHVIVRGLHWRQYLACFRSIKTHSRTAMRNDGSGVPDKVAEDSTWR